MTIYKTVKEHNKLPLNVNGSGNFEKFIQYEDWRKEQDLLLGNVISTNKLPKLYDYIFGATDVNPMYMDE